MKPTVMLMAGVAAIALAGCDSRGAPTLGPPAMKTLAKLNCPDREGDLKRVSAAADGKSCRYTDADGSEVTLELVPVSGDANAALKPIEMRLAALVPDINAKAPAAVAEAAADKAAAKDAAAISAVAASDAGVTASATAEAKVGSGSGDQHDDSDDKVTVDLPGLHVRTEGDNANVNVMGMHVNVDEKSDTVRVRREPKSGYGHRFAVDANDNGAVIRMEQGNRTNIKATVKYAMEMPGAQGDRVVGYVARGPRTGPLVVATVRSKVNEEDHGDLNDGLFGDAGKLVRKAFRG
jgi:hypothetical protein